jgi:hypothetical protein
VSHANKNKEKKQMKKIMMMLAVVMAAAMTQAAAVSWKVTTPIDANGTAIANNAAGYTCTVSFFTDAGAANAFAAGGTLSDTSITMKQFSGKTANTFVQDTTYYAVLTLEDSNLNKVITSEVAAFTVGPQDPTINFTNGAGFDTETAKVDFANGWQAVPEPTSGLLLLLGVAGLALKRKRA